MKLKKTPQYFSTEPKLPPLLVVTSEKIVMKEELKCTFRFKKFTLLFNNGKNSGNPKIKRGGLLKSAKKEKSCKSFDLQDYAEREALTSL